MQGALLRQVRTQSCLHFKKLCLNYKTNRYQYKAMLSFYSLICSVPRTKRHCTTLKLSLVCFKQYLTHSDSYLYLASINGLVELALSTQPSAGNIISTLCQEYSCLAGEPNAKARAMYDQDTGQPLRSPSPPPSKLPAVETRMKIGEALVKICSELGDMLPHYLEEIVASLLTGGQGS